MDPHRPPWSHPPLCASSSAGALLPPRFPCLDLFESRFLANFPLQGLLDAGAPCPVYPTGRLSWVQLSPPRSTITPTTISTTAWLTWTTKESTSSCPDIPPPQQWLLLLPLLTNITSSSTPTSQVLPNRTPAFPLHHLPWPMNTIIPSSTTVSHNTPKRFISTTIFPLMEKKSSILPKISPPSTGSPPVRLCPTFPPHDQVPARVSCHREPEHRAQPPSLPYARAALCRVVPSHQALPLLKKTIKLPIASCRKPTR